MKILIIRTNISNTKEYTDRHLAKIKKISKNIDLKLIDPKKEIVDKYLPEVETILCSRYGYSDFLDFAKANKLKWVHITSTGVGDTAATLKDKKILLTNSSGVASIPIAEHVFLFMLVFARQLDKSYRIQIEKQRWVRDADFPKPIELYNKTISIVGFGRVGKQIAKIAKSLGMYVNVLMYQTPVRNINVDKVYQEKNLDRMLRKSDFVISCLPLTDKTQKLFTYKKFKQMKKTAYFINVGKGPTVDEKDLIRALKEKIIAGTGLDVFEKEPLPETSKLWKIKNVLITPHYAGMTPHYTDRVIDIFCLNLKAYLKNKTLPNLVDKNKGY